MLARGFQINLARNTFIIFVDTNKPLAILQNKSNNFFSRGTSEKEINEVH
jgi:hypothetical protein